MRSILNISLPTTLADIVKKEVKKGNFASTSEFFRHLLRLWNDNKLSYELKKSERDFANGNFKTLKSLKDLR
jgi:Arc/MetJ-type ribon-helix-helix transcriptional regulator